MTVLVSNVLRWLGGKIDIKVEVEILSEGGGVWDTGEWDEAHWATYDWYDITKYVESIRISRGQPKWESRYSAGSLKLTLDNTSGLFTPEVEPNLDAVPWRPGRKIRVLAYPDPTNSDTFYPLFTGRIVDSSDAHDFSMDNVVNTTEALDALAELQAFNPLALETPTGVQSTSERVHAALDRIGWPVGKRVVQSGLHTMQTSYLAQTTLEECQRAAEAEGGALFADADNNVVFKFRDWLTDPAWHVSPLFEHSLNGSFEMSGIEWVGNYLWMLRQGVFGGDAAALLRLDPKTGDVVETILIEDNSSNGISAVGLAWDGVGFWIATYDYTAGGGLTAESERLVRVSAVTGEEQVVHAVSDTNYRGLAYGPDGLLWAFDDNLFEVVQIDPATGAVVNSQDGSAVYGASSSFTNFSWAQGFLWMSDPDAETLTRFDASDPDNPVVLDVIDLDALGIDPIRSLSYGDGHLWGASFDDVFDISSNTRSLEVQGYLGYDSEQEEGKPHAHILSIKPSWDINRIVNHISMARSGGEAYLTQDFDSQSQFGIRTYQFFDMKNALNSTGEAEVKFLADRMLAARKDLRLRIDSVTIAANDDPNNEDLNRLFYATQFGDLLAVNLDSGRGWGYERLGHVIGIEHYITAEDWEVTFTLDDALVDLGGS